MSLQIRRGTTAELATIVPDSGEPIWTTDAKKLYVGDGNTIGGNLVTAAQDVSTTSNVTFNTVVVTNTATVGAIKFPDGSIQTTADTANPDQSLNTTSNVRFNSAIIATTATVTAIKFADGSVQTTADEANFNQTLNTYDNVAFNKITIATTATVNGELIAYVNGNQSFKLDQNTGTITLSSSGYSANINCFNDLPFSLGSTVNTNNLNLTQTNFQINRPTKFGGQSILTDYSTSTITHYVDTLPFQNGAVNFGSTSTRFNQLFTQRLQTYQTTNTSVTAAQTLGTLFGGVWNIYFGRGPQANDNLPQNGATGSQISAFGYGGGGLFLSGWSMGSRVAGNWSTGTSVNLGVNTVEFLAVPNMRTVDPAIPPQTIAPNVLQRNWGTTPTTTWPPVLQNIEGLSANPITLGAYSKGDNTATIINSIGMEKQFLNTKLFLYGAPSQDSTSTTAGYNTLNFVATRYSGISGYRRSIANGDYLGEIVFRGIGASDSASGTGSLGASIQATAATTWVSTNTFTSLIFNTVKKDASSLSQRMSIDSDNMNISSNVIAGADSNGNSYFAFRSTGGGNYIWNTTTFDDDVIIGGNDGVKQQAFTATNITSTATQQVGYFDTTSLDSAKFLVSITDSGEIHFAEVSVISDGTDIWKVEYGTNTSNGALGTFSVAMNGALATLYFAPTAPTSMNIKSLVTAL